MQCFGFGGSRLSKVLFSVEKILYCFSVALQHHWEYFNESILSLYAIFLLLLER